LLLLPLPERALLLLLLLFVLLLSSSTVIMRSRHCTNQQQQQQCQGVIGDALCKAMEQVQHSHLIRAPCGHGSLILRSTLFASQAGAPR
jgi:hypothetical protein